MRDTEPVTIDPRTAAHWDDAYSIGDTTRSWFQSEPVLSLAMLDTVCAASSDSVIDVGGGASTLTDALLWRGFDDLTVLDMSQTGMRTAQRRLGADSRRGAVGRRGPPHLASRTHVPSLA